VLTIALLCACGRGGGEHRDSQSPLGPVKNPSDFPLYPRSEVVSVVPVDSTQMFAAIHASDPTAHVPENYRGHVIIAETGATLAQVQSWVAALQSAPPRGFRETTTHPRTSHKRTSSDKNRFDINGDGTAQFETADASRWVYLITAEPRKIYEQGGALFALIDAYSATPDFLRGPIDDQARKQTGYTITQMLDAKSPAGAIIAEIKRLKSTDRRAILLIDETKAK